MNSMTMPQGEPGKTIPASSQGAVDLATHVAQHPYTPGQPSAPDETADIVSARVDLPLIAEASDETFQAVMQTSTVVPVVVVFWSQASLESRGALEIMENSARHYGGRFQLVKVDLAHGQGIAQAFQIQDLPAAAAIIAGRPVPLFQGQVTAEHVTAVMDELLSVAAQMGVTAGIRVTAEDTAAPIPEEHLPARHAEEAGDVDGAIAAWEKVVEHHPKDQVALAELARLRLLQRAAQSSDGQGSAAAQADAAFAQGHHDEAFTLLLNVVETTSDTEEKDAARARLVELFRIAGSTPEVRAARQKLATLLMV